MNNQIIELAKRYKELDSNAAEQKMKLDAINAEWTAVENSLLEAMVEEGVNGVRLEGVGLFSMVTKNRLSVTIANKPQFFQYLKASGNGALIKEDVNSQTLSAFLNGHLDELIRAGVATGLDEVDARNASLAALNKHGASYFTERTVRMKAL